MPENKKWRKFERLVAALHRVEMNGATIKWNEKINGRQFDVTIRFENGPYKYLTVVECKNYTSAVKAEKVDGLVTKAKDAGADKAIMFSACGFQSGAIDVAKKHGIPLFSLSQPSEIPDELLAPQCVEYIQIYDVSLIGGDGSRFFLPKEPMKLHYYVNETVVEHPLGRVSLTKLIDMHQHILSGRQLDDVLHYGVDFDPMGYAVFPEMERDKPMFVKSVWWKMANRVGRPLKEPIGLDPALFVMPYEVKDELAGKVRYVQANIINDDEGADIIEGQFYRLRNLGIYYCEKIEGGVTTIIMIESYQHGRFLQVVFKAEMKKHPGYVQITDHDELDRLHWRLSEFYKIHRQRGVP